MMKDKVKRGKGLEYQVENLSIDDLNDIANFIEGVGKDLRDLAASKNWTPN